MVGRVLGRSSISTSTSKRPQTRNWKEGEAPFGRFRKFEVEVEVEVEDAVEVETPPIQTDSATLDY
jgi:hypothetical protein